jgi:hypothetical protein
MTRHTAGTVQKHVQHPTLVGNVREALQSLNANYGYGDVESVRVFFDGRIEFDVKGFQMRPQTRRGHLVNGRTVKALGHQKTIENRQGVGALRPQVTTEGLGHEALLQIWLERKPDALSPYAIDGHPPMWTTVELEDGYVLFTRPARAFERLAPFMPYAEVDGVAFQFQKDGNWIGQGQKVSLTSFEKNGATLVY